MSALLEARGLRKRFGLRQVLDGASLALEPGEIVALFGENGAGKSTLLQILAGILVPGEGSVVLGGHDLRTHRPQALGRLGFAPERADIPEHLLVAEWFDLVASLRRAPPPDDALLARWSVGALRGLRVGSLSLGQHRRVALAAAQIGSPPVLVLDEPTNGLDGAMLDALALALRQHADAGGAVFFATHDQAFAARVSTRRVELREGKLAG